MPYKDKNKQLESQRKFYQANKEKVKGWVSKRKEKMKTFLRDIKVKLKCLECDETHPACIVFHHRNPKEKDFGIAQAVSQGWGKEKILAEIAKCDIYCSNCHLKLHWENKDIFGPWV